MSNTPVRNVGSGAGFLFQGFQLMWKPGLRSLVLIPMTLNVLLFAWLVHWSAGVVTPWIEAIMGWLPDWLAFLDWLLWLVYGIVIIMALAYTFVAVANIIGAPFYGYLAERTELYLTGKTAEVEESQGAFKAITTSIFSSISREVSKQLYYLPRAIGLLILGLIPGINIIGGLLWFLFSAWMMAVQYVDYPAENHQLTFKELRAYLGDNRLTSLSFGIVVFLAAMIPVVNLFTVPAAVCGGTIYWVNVKRKDN